MVPCLCQPMLLLFVCLLLLFVVTICCCCLLLLVSTTTTTTPVVDPPSSLCHCFFTLFTLLYSQISKMFVLQPLDGWSGGSVAASPTAQPVQSWSVVFWLSFKGPLSTYDIIDIIYYIKTIIFICTQI